MKKIVILILAVAIISGVYLYLKGQNRGNTVACTMEAKQCSDGSYVGRTGPNCEFAACPSSEVTHWKTYNDSDQKISFLYPDPFPAKYISPQEWPPKIQIKSGTTPCDEPPIKINGHFYCVSEKEGAAAGSTYTTFQYITVNKTEDKTITIDFTLRYPQCANYEEDKKGACLSERDSFDITRIVDSIMQSVKSNK